MLREVPSEFFGTASSLQASAPWSSALPLFCGYCNPLFNMIECDRKFCLRIGRMPFCARNGRFGARTRIPAILLTLQMMLLNKLLWIEKKEEEDVSALLYFYAFVGFVCALVCVVCYQQSVIKHSNALKRMLLDPGMEPGTPSLYTWSILSSCMCSAIGVAHVALVAPAASAAASIVPSSTYVCTSTPPVCYIREARVD